MLTRSVLFERFLGRRIELEHLNALRMESARQLTLRAASIIGEAGLGKSRLVSEFETTNVGPGAAIVRTRCEEFATAYAPIIDALERLQYRRELLHNTPLASALGALTSSQSRDDDERKRDVLQAVSKAISVAAKRLGQLTLVVDDVHWSDLASLDIVGHIAASVRDAPLFLIVTYRPEDIANDHTRGRSIGEIERRGFDRVRLAPLALGEIASLVRDALPNASLESVAKIYAISEGKPYVAEELARSVGGSGTIDAGTVPSLRSSVLDRVVLLERDERSVVEAACVIGQHFDAAQLRALKFSDELSVGALRAALKLQLLEERDVAGEPRFCFRHALTREILYGNVDPEERKRLHAQIAAFLAASNGSITALAYHLSAAGDADAAVGANERAGDEARAVAANADAAVLYLRALHFTDDPSAVGRIGRKLATAFRFVGDAIDGTYDAIGRIAGQLAAAGRPDDALAMLVADDAVRASTNRFAEVFARIESARSLLHERTPSDLRFDFEMVYANCLSTAGRYREALAATDRAEAVASPTAHAHNTLALGRAITFVYLHDVERAQAAIDSLRPEEGGRSFINEALALSHLADLYAQLGRMREAFDVSLRAAAILDRGGSDWGRWRQRFHAAFYAAEVGNFEYIEDLAGEAARGGQERGDALEGALVRVVRARGGDPAALVAMFEEALEGRTGFLLHALVCDLPFIVDDRQLSADIVRRGIGRLQHAFVDGGVAEAAIVFGSDDDMNLAIARFRTECRTESLTQRLEHHIVEARLALRLHRPLESVKQARLAAPLAAQTEQWLHQATALELAGDVAAARDALVRVGAEAELRRLADRHGSPSASKPNVALTKREFQVARCSAAGLSSREASLRLAISARTVEAHLAHVYEKLGIASRAELIAWLESAHSK